MATDQKDPMPVGTVRTVLLGAYLVLLGALLVALLALLWPDKADGQELVTGVRLFGSEVLVCTISYEVRLIGTCSVQVNASDRKPTSVAADQIVFDLTPTDVAQAGKLKITVVNPAPGGGSSNTLDLTITS
jgi:hypothetical protein